MHYDEINEGDPVTVTSRGNMPAVVVRKFKSSEAAPDAPAGTEYVWVRRISNNWECLNYPHQLEPRTPRF